MEFSDNKFEWMSHGDSGNVIDSVYRTKLGEEINENKRVKNLGIEFKFVRTLFHIWSIVNSQRALFQARLICEASSDSETL